MNFFRCATLVGALAAAVIQPPLAAAKDYGVQGNTWKITEIDIRQLVVESASRADWGKVKNELVKSAKSYGDRLPKRYLSTSPDTTVVWHDPSFTLTSDIKAPVKAADGTISWQVLKKKGTRVNPLDYQRPLQPLFYFDGGDPSQVALVQKLVRESIRFIPVEAGSGNPEALAKQYGVPVFYADSFMMSKFDVKYLPAALYPGEGAHREQLGVFYYAKPFSAAYVMKSLGITADGPVHPVGKTTQGSK